MTAIQQKLEDLGGTRGTALLANGTNLDTVLGQLNTNINTVKNNILAEVNKVSTAMDAKSGTPGSITSLAAFTDLATLQAYITRLTTTDLAAVETHAKTTAPFPVTVVTEVNKLVDKLEPTLTGKPSKSAPVDPDGKNLSTVVTALEGLIDDAVVKAGSSGLPSTAEAINKADVTSIYKIIDDMVANHPQIGTMAKPGVTAANLKEYLIERQTLIGDIPGGLYAAGIAGQDASSLALLAENLKKGLLAAVKGKGSASVKSKINAVVPSLIP